MVVDVGTDPDVAPLALYVIDAVNRAKRVALPVTV